MRLEAAQAAQEQEVLTMRCLDSFATKDDAGQERRSGAVTFQRGEI